MPPANRLQTTKKFEPNKANVVGVVLPKDADLKQSTRAPVREAGTLCRFDRCIVGWWSVGPMVAKRGGKK
jgi:hypothetical protein